MPIDPFVVKRHVCQDETGQSRDDSYKWMRDNVEEAIPKICIVAGIKSVKKAAGSFLTLNVWSIRPLAQVGCGRQRLPVKVMDERLRRPRNPTYSYASRNVASPAAGERDPGWSEMKKEGHAQSGISATCLTARQCEDCIRAATAC